MPDAHRVAVGQLHHRQIGRLHLDHRDVGLLVRADHLRRKFAAILELYLDSVGAFHDVDIGVDVTILPNDKAGAFALHRLKRCGARRGSLSSGALEERSSSEMSFAVGFLCHFNDDDARRDDLEDLGESAVELMNDIFSRRCRGRSGNGRRGLDVGYWRGRTAQTACNA